MRFLPEASFFLLLSLPAAHFYSLIEAPVRRQLSYAAGFALLAFFATCWLVPIISAYLMRRGLKGRDMGRRGTRDEAKEMCVRARARPPLPPRCLPPHPLPPPRPSPRRRRRRTPPPLPPPF
jgi:hypothetical protein